MSEGLAVLGSVIPTPLWRLAIPSCLDGGKLLPNSFDLRLELNPPEGYISFWAGTGATVNEKLNFVANKILSIRPLPRNGKLLAVDLDEVEDSINQPNRVIGFSEERCPHYGMRYLVDDECLILEAKTMLAEISSLHSYACVLEERKLSCSCT